MYLAPVSTSTIPSLSGIPSFKADQSLPGISKDGSYKSIYKYWDYSLDVNRLFTANKVFKIKVGIGIKAQQLRYWSNKLVAITADGDGNYYYRGGYSPSLNKWLTTIQVKAGLIEDLNKTVQLQLCPLVYYSLNSMYKRDYLIKQKNYGVGLECLLLFKIR